jgi:hypothetical protein
MDKNLIDKDNIARQYASHSGFDSLRAAGNDEEWAYFHLFNKANIGHKTGLPYVIKINNTGQITIVKELKEIMWAALHEEVELL